MKYRSRTQDDSWMGLFCHLFVDRVHIGMFPNVREILLMQKCLKKQSKDRG